MPFDNKIRVYDKNKNLLAIFDGEVETSDQDVMMNMMVAPTVHIEMNGSSTFSFQMLANSERWNQIKDPENIYYVNGRYYTALEEDSYEYDGEESVRVVNVSLVETWYLLDRKYVQAYNCGVYLYAKATFRGYTTDGAIFRISRLNKYDIQNPGNTISPEYLWDQIIKWTSTDSNGNKLSYSILQDDTHKPKNWDDPPSAVFMKSMTNATISSFYRDFTIESRVKQKISQTFKYNQNGTYTIDASPAPASIDKVFVNYTLQEGSGRNTIFKTSEKEINFTYNASNKTVSTTYRKQSNEFVNGVIIEYTYNDLGDIKSGASCWFAFGAESIDEHTFVILPKADTKYRLTINGRSYNDSEVKDERGVIMPRGSGGYAMWAALKDSGWSLGICDVIATGFNPSEDYGVFNVESDMKDVLYNVQYIQQLYGGILDWDSEHNVLNYRAENSTDYQAYDDGFNNWTGMEFREGKNMTSVPIVTYDNKIITKAYVLGYGNLNIKSVNSGKGYIEDHSYTDAVYTGYINQDLIFDTNDEGGQKQLLYWGKKELSKKCRPRKSINLSVTDLRTSEGYEHEIFDIGDIVRVYYRDDIGEKEVIDEKRITMWEYNVFAMWDCSIELGDKVQNLSELFKLIYKNKDKIPGSNASGNIPSNKIEIEIGNGSDFNYGEENSLIHYIEQIAQTTTENSNAIAGLILDTNELYSSVDLFSYYEKETSEMLSKTYAGLTMYADESSAQAALRVTNEYKNYVTGVISTTTSALEQYADNKTASLKAYVDGTFHNTITGEITKASAGLTTKIESVDNKHTNAESSLRTSINNYSATLNQTVTKVDSDYEIMQNFISGTNENFSSVYSNYSDLNEELKAQSGLIARIGDVVAGVDIEVGKIDDKIKSAVDIYAGDIKSLTASISVDGSGRITIGALNGVSIEDSYLYGSVSILNRNPVRWVQLKFKGWDNENYSYYVLTY